MSVRRSVLLLLVGLALVSGCGLKAEERTPVPTLVFLRQATLTPLPTFTVTPASGATDGPSGAMLTPTGRPFPRYTSAAPAALTYVVRKGDTLSRIAKEQGVSVDDLAKANNIANRNVLEVGQLLTIPGKALRAAQPAPTSGGPGAPTGPPTATSSSAWRIVLTGDLAALQKDGQYRWPAIAVECFGAGGQRLGQVGLDRVDGHYELPAGTAQVRLWIGDALEGPQWWKRWDCQPANAGGEIITLKIVKH